MAQDTELQIKVIVENADKIDKLEASIKKLKEALEGIKELKGLKGLNDLVVSKGSGGGARTNNITSAAGGSNPLTATHKKQAAQKKETDDAAKAFAKALVKEQDKMGKSLPIRKRPPFTKPYLDRVLHGYYDNPYLQANKKGDAIYSYSKIGGLFGDMRTWEKVYDVPAKNRRQVSSGRSYEDEPLFAHEGRSHIDGEVRRSFELHKKSQRLKKAKDKLEKEWGNVVGRAVGKGALRTATLANAPDLSDPIDVSMLFGASGGGKRSTYSTSRGRLWGSNYDLASLAAGPAGGARGGVLWALNAGGYLGRIGGRSNFGNNFNIRANYRGKLDALGPGMVSALSVGRGSNPFYPHHSEYSTMTPTYDRSGMYSRQAARYAAGRVGVGALKFGGAAAVVTGALGVAAEVLGLNRASSLEGTAMGLDKARLTYNAMTNNKRLSASDMSKAGFLTGARFGGFSKAGALNFLTEASLAGIDPTSRLGSLAHYTTFQGFGVSGVKSALSGNYEALIRARNVTLPKGKKVGMGDMKSAIFASILGGMQGSDPIERAVMYPIQKALLTTFLGKGAIEDEAVSGATQSILGKKMRQEGDSMAANLHKVNDELDRFKSAIHGVANEMSGFLVKMQNMIKER